MATVSLAANVGGASLPDALDRATTTQRVAAFDNALGRRTAEALPPEATLRPDAAASVSPPTGTAAAKPVAPSDMPYENTVSSRDRVRRSLELGGTPAANEGDAILGGLQKLRGVFDAQHQRINQIMSTQSVDAKTLLSMQVEMAQYSVLVDVSSKLTGKSTQLFDTLMKGQ